MNNIVRGNDELAFFMREFNGNIAEAQATYCLSLDESGNRFCPLFDFYTSYSRLLLDHVKNHANNRFVREHRYETALMNISIAILQQVIIYETNLVNLKVSVKERTKKYRIRAIAAYKLQSEVGIPLSILGKILGLSYKGSVAPLVADGFMIEKQNDIPQWLSNVCTKIDGEVK